MGARERDAEPGILTELLLQERLQPGRAVLGMKGAFPPRDRFAFDIVMQSRRVGDLQVGEVLGNEIFDLRLQPRRSPRLKDLAAMVDVECRQGVRAELRPAGGVGHGEAEAENAPGRGPDDEIEQIRCRALRLVLEPGDDGGRDHAANATAIECQNSERLRLVGHRHHQAA